MNERHNTPYDDSDNEGMNLSSTVADAEGTVGISASPHRTQRGSDSNGNVNENSFGSSLESNVYAEPSTSDNEDHGADAEVGGVGSSGGRNGNGSNDNRQQWSTNMMIDENFDLNSPVVSPGVASSRGNVDQQLSPRSQAQSSTTFLTASPRLTKYLCIASVFLVLCSLGLATAGLGLIYTSNNKMNSNSDATSMAPSVGSGFDNADKEMTNSVLEMNAEDTEEDQTDAKAKLTDEPTTSPTLLEVDVSETTTTSTTTTITTSATEAEVAKVETSVEPNATTTTTSTVTTANNTDGNQTTADSDTNNSSSVTVTIPLVPNTLHSTTLHAIADTFLEQNSTQPYGQVKRLKVDAVPPRATLMKFNISSLILEQNILPKDIVGYSLRLYSLASSPFGGKVDVLKRSCNSWNENNITWDNAPRCVFQNNSHLAGEFEKAIPEYAWNEARLYMDEEILRGQVITFRITSHYSDGVMYASRENLTAIPELVVFHTSSNTTTTNATTTTTAETVPTPTPTEAVSSSLEPQQEVVNATSSPSVMTVLSTPTISPVPTVS